MVRVEGAREDIYPVVEVVGMWESRRDFQRVWEGWEAGFMAFHAFHTLSFPWPAFRVANVDKITRYAATQCNAPHSPSDAHRYSSLVIECISDNNAPIDGRVTVLPTSATRRSISNKFSASGTVCLNERLLLRTRLSNWYAETSVA